MPLLLARLVPALFIIAVLVLIFFGPKTLREATKDVKFDRTRITFVVIISIAASIIALYYILIYSTY